MAPIPINTRHHVFHDATDRTTDEIDSVVPDFSEFRDPWDNYVHREHIKQLRDQCMNQVEQTHQAFVNYDNHICQISHDHDHSHNITVQGHQLEHDVHRWDSRPIDNTIGIHHYEDQGHSNSQISHSEYRNQHSSHQTHSPCVDYQPQTQTYQEIHRQEEIRHEHVENSHLSLNQSQNQHQATTDLQCKQTQVEIHHSHEDHTHDEIQFSEDRQNRLTGITHACDHANEHSYKDSHQSRSSHHTPDRLTGEVNESKVNIKETMDVTMPQSHSQSCTESSSTATHTDVYTGDGQNSNVSTN